MIDNGDLHMFICDQLHVHNIEVATEAPNAGYLLIFVKNFIFFTLETYFASTAREMGD
jgi:hypothetical protein